MSVSYRGRKPTGSGAPLGGGSTIVSPETNGGSVVASSVQPSSRPSPQPTQIQQSMPVQQQPMTPMSFYTDPNRFPTPVWQADPSQGWPQGQFIQQIPAGGQPIEAYQQYPNGIYQTTYQQPAFETNTFYTGAVQVLTNPRPPSTPNQQVQLAPPRPNSNYSHTPSPSPVQQQQQTTSGRQYQEYNIPQQSGGQQQSSQQNFIQSTSNTTAENSQAGNNSRPASVNTIMNPSTPNQNFSPQAQHQQQQNTQQHQNQVSQQQTNTYTSISNFSPNPSINYVNANSGNAQPGYPQVNSSSPQLDSHSSSGYPGQEQYSGQEHQHWQNDGQIIWEQQVKLESNYDHQDQTNQYMQQINNSPTKMENVQDEAQTSKPFSQSDKVNLNTRIKTMILNKQQDNIKMEEAKHVEQNSTGHFLSYSHHHHLTNPSGDDGGFQNRSSFEKYDLQLSRSNHTQINSGSLNQHRNVRFAQTNKVQNYDDTMFTNSAVHSFYNNNTLKLEIKNQQHSVHENDLSPGQNNDRPTSITPKKEDFIYSIKSENNYQCTENSTTLDRDTFQIKEKSEVREGRFNQNKNVYKSTPLKEKKTKTNYSTSTPIKNKLSVSPISLKKCKQLGMEIPSCKCFPPDEAPSEPGTYYTHLGCANSLKSLRYNLECKTGVAGMSIRIEKIRYTGKEGKTSQGCPIAKWVIRRQNQNEKYLVIVKQRMGHFCHSAFIVVCLVMWEGVEQGNADELYSLLTNKLNKFGLPTKRRCATNEPRTCACQGIDEKTCGASFTFGCSWSMYYNGCKFTRSKEVRKFRLTEKDEEAIVEEKLQDLADHINPIYRCLAPQSFENQCRFDNIASDCRLGRTPGRPFSGVTACVDFCAHAHKDMHNMIDGCTVVVTLTKHRNLSKPFEEQLHVLPLYVADDTDEFESKENQEIKIKNGSIEVLEKYSCEVRTSSTPSEKCVARKTKKAEERKQNKKKLSSSEQSFSSRSSTPLLYTPINNKEVQNGQVSSTALDFSNKNNSRSLSRKIALCVSRQADFHIILILTLVARLLKD